MVRGKIQAVQERNKKIRNKFWMLKKIRPDLSNRKVIEMLAGDLEFKVSARTVRRVIYEWKDGEE